MRSLMCFLKFNQWILLICYVFLKQLLLLPLPDETTTVKILKRVTIACGILISLR